MVLSGTAALRAGAGTLQVANIRTAAGIALPEAMVIGLTVRGGEVDADAAASVLRARVPRANATLVGPGMFNVSNASRIVTTVAALVAEGSTLLLDGAAIPALRHKEAALGRIAGWHTMRRIITPNAGEMAALLELPEDEVRANAAEVAQHCAGQYNSVVVLKGSETWIAHPTAPIVHYRDGKAGLATSGSGDVLAGVIAGLAARGAEPLTAAMWGVWAHGSAGTRLSRSVGKVGFLARELLPEIPSFVND